MESKSPVLPPAYTRVPDHQTTNPANPPPPVPSQHTQARFYRFDPTLTELERPDGGTIMLNEQRMRELGAPAIKECKMRLVVCHGFGQGHDSAVLQLLPLTFKPASESAKEAAEREATLRAALMERAKQRAAKDVWRWRDVFFIWRWRGAPWQWSEKEAGPHATRALDYFWSGYADLVWTWGEFKSVFKGATSPEEWARRGLSYHMAPGHYTEIMSCTKELVECVEAGLRQPVDKPRGWKEAHA
jgi:hypothetical protein